MSWCRCLLGPIIALVLVWLMTSCSPSSSPTDGDADVDSDTDADSDVPEDADPPPDGDADSDGDTDADWDIDEIDGDLDADFEADAEIDADPEPPPPLETCDACETHEQCGPGAFCVSMTEGGLACVPSCVIDLPECPRAFHCVIDVGRGVDEPLCLPIGARCCVDEDADEYGQGVGCLGEDCDDEDPLRNPGLDELCNGFDDDCDEEVDEPPTDCVSGICADDGDGTYTALEGAHCVDAECLEGTITDCDLYTCDGGGEVGDFCAVICNPEGVDDELFCIDPAHCDDGLCDPDFPNGEACDEDSDCISGHCDNGFCCDEGTCCGVVTDCPGGGEPVTICEDHETCQGSRGETECTDFQCHTIEGIPDDTACAEEIEALDCGLYDPIYCTGEEDQEEPECPSFCLTDEECIPEAHCEGGFCVPNRPPGGLCIRNGECQDELYCVDSVCCTSECTGLCEACDLPATRGTCTNVPPGTDPDNECPGFSCAPYFTGFAGDDDTCYYRADADDGRAACNGAGACLSPDVLCPTQPRGALQIDCNDVCQAPRAGTCSDRTPGACDNLDATAGTTTCGRGECEREVQRCVEGREQACVPGTPEPETCNGLDDDCDGTVDDGAAADLCPAAPEVTSYVCTEAGECRIGDCTRHHYDVNLVYDDGCECSEDLYTTNHACGAAFDLGSVAIRGSRDVRGQLIPSAGLDEDWFQVSFPADGRPGGGTPRIRLEAGSAANFSITILNGACGGSLLECQDEETSSNLITDFEMVDNQARPGVNQWSSNPDPWPQRVYFSVTRSPGAPPMRNCEDGEYRVLITR